MDTSTQPLLPIRDLDPSQRPRERLLRDGPHALEPDELLAIVLVTGRGSGEDVRQLAHRVLSELGGIDGLAAADVDELRTLRGIGPVRAARIRAALELGLRAMSIDLLAPRDEGAADGFSARLDLPDPFEIVAGHLRGELPGGARGLLAYSPGEARVCRLADGLDDTPSGALAELARESANGPWWIGQLRPAGEETVDERAAATQLLHAADAVGLDVHHVLLVEPTRHAVLATALSATGR